MKLIIAEKPSLARNIAAGIGKNPVRRDGYLECGEYLISWAFGHLFSLADIEAYDESGTPREGRRWTMDNLPCFPKTFRYELRRGDDKRPDSGVEKQYRTIEALCNRPDVDLIINAGDADREGEIIVRTCVKNALHSNKKQTRLWLPDQTPETIAKALAEMQDESAYDNLANEGYARTYIDWLYGVNLTRYATLKTGKLLRVGRVIIPIVKAIYDRDLAIRNFTPEKYFAPVSRAATNGEVVELTSKKKFKATEGREAAAYCAALNAAGAVVTAHKSKKDKLSPGKLYSLSKLQNVLGKKYKMSMTDSLAIIQKLYEEGYLTYPRTNSEYLATAEKDKVKKILAGVAALGYPVKFKDSKQIFDDAKIESHSALTPTYKIPDKTKLTPEEAQVYSTVLRRFVAVFCANDCIVERTELEISCGDIESFTLKGTAILEPGFTKYDDAGIKDKILPPLKKGDRVEVDFTPAEKETSPPKHYTIETLNNYLKNPFKEDKAALAEAHDAEPTEEGDDTEDYRAIFEGLELGTEATRTGIIDNAKKSNYIQLKKDVYTILPDGEYLIEALTRLDISMDKYRTSEMGRALKRVFRGTMTVGESVRLAEEEIRHVFEKKQSAPERDTDTGLFGDEAGVCPLCGGTVRRTSFGYGCANYREKECRFTIREVICGRTIPIAMVRLLLSEGRTGLIEGFVSPKTGRSFDAHLVLQEGRAVFEFPERRQSTPAFPPQGGYAPPPMPQDGGYMPPPEVPPYPENPLPDWVKKQ